MTNTAISAKKETTHTITFKNKEHEKFYNEYLPQCRYQDVYHRALVYCLGISEDTRNNAKKIYDFKTGYVQTECLYEGWQTSGSMKIVRMAFIVTERQVLRRNRSLPSEDNLLISREWSQRARTESGQENIRKTGGRAYDRKRNKKVSWQIQSE